MSQETTWRNTGQPPARGRGGAVGKSLDCGFWLEEICQAG